MEIRFECNVRDYLEAQNAYYWRSARGAMSACLLAGCALVGTWLAAIGSSNSYLFFGFIFLWATLWFLWRPVYFRRDFRKQSKLLAREPSNLVTTGFLSKTTSGEVKLNGLHL